MIVGVCSTFPRYEELEDKSILTVEFCTPLLILTSTRDAVSIHLIVTAVYSVDVLLYMNMLCFLVRF